MEQETTKTIEIDWREACFAVIEAVGNNEGVIFHDEWDVSEEARAQILAEWKQWQAEKDKRRGLR